MASNGVIGDRNQLPWRLSEDLRHFRRTTMGHSIIMGRKTWESIGKALPGRTNIVVSRQLDYIAAGAEVRHSLEAALELAGQIARSEDIDQVFVIGGAELYSQALPLAEIFHLTEIHAEIPGDTALGGFDESEWREVSRRDFPSDEKTPFDYSIRLLLR